MSALSSYTTSVAPANNESVPPLISHALVLLNK